MAAGRWLAAKPRDAIRLPGQRAMLVAPILPSSRFRRNAQRLITKRRKRISSPIPAVAEATSDAGNCDHRRHLTHSF